MYIINKVPPFHPQPQPHAHAVHQLAPFPHCPHIDSHVPVQFISFIAARIVPPFPQPPPQPAPATGQALFPQPPQPPHADEDHLYCAGVTKDAGQQRA